MSGQRDVAVATEAKITSSDAGLAFRSDQRASRLRSLESDEAGRSRSGELAIKNHISKLAAIHE